MASKRFRKKKQQKWSQCFKSRTGHKRVSNAVFFISCFLLFSRERKAKSKERNNQFKKELASALLGERHSKRIIKGGGGRICKVYYAFFQEGACVKAVSCKWVASPFDSCFGQHQSKNTSIRLSLTLDAQSVTAIDVPTCKRISIVSRCHPSRDSLLVFAVFFR